MELTIEGLAAGGDGVGRAPDGRVVFVPFTAPGDRVRVRPSGRTGPRARYLRARVETLLVPGPGRTDPVCPVFGSCGGCAWQHLSPDVQRDAKGRIVADALRRIGGLDFSGEVPVVPSPEPYGYRVRARVLREQGLSGFRRRRSHRIQPVSRCPVLSPAADRALHALSLDEAAGGDGEWEIAVSPDRQRAAPLGKGDPIEIAVSGDRLRISPGVFFQSNGLLHDALAAAVVAAAGRGDLVLELFAGAGFFTLGLSRAFDRVRAVESHPAAASDLRHNLARAGRANVEVHCAPLESLHDALPAAPVIVLDPPRSGLPAGSAERLAAHPADRLVYLSCDPATLARDLAVLAAGRRRRLVHVEAFDLFPQTPHVEVLVVLER